MSGVARGTPRHADHVVSPEGFTGAGLGGCRRRRPDGWGECCPHREVPGPEHVQFDQRVECIS